MIFLLISRKTHSVKESVERFCFKEKGVCVIGEKD